MLVICFVGLSWALRWLWYGDFDCSCVGCCCACCMERCDMADLTWCVNCQFWWEAMLLCTIWRAKWIPRLWPWVKVWFSFWLASRNATNFFWCSCEFLRGLFFLARFSWNSCIKAQWLLWSLSWVWRALWNSPYIICWRTCPFNIHNSSSIRK